MNYYKYKIMPNEKMPKNIARKLENSGGIHETRFADKNNILENEELQKEFGFTKLSNREYLVSMMCPMPGVTKEMIDWWFWWHPQNKERYQLWFPGEHFDIYTAKENNEYFSCLTMPEFQPNTQYPVEKIGGMKMPLQIDFVRPTDFGFSEGAMERSNIATIVCGHVGVAVNPTHAKEGLGITIYHTEMAHMYFQKEDGLFLVSRFWLGHSLKSKTLAKFMLTDSTARGMAQHCCVEYRNLAKKLPIIYNEVNGKQ